MQRWTHGGLTANSLVAVTFGMYMQGTIERICLPGVRLLHDDVIYSHTQYCMTMLCIYVAAKNTPFESLGFWLLK